MTSMNNTKYVQFIEEQQPSEKWLSFYKSSIEGYKKWFLKEGEFNRPNYQACHNAIKEYKLYWFFCDYFFQNYIISSFYF